MKAPNTCSVVLVAEPFLQDLSAVMDIVDRLSNDMKRIPYAMLLIMENTSTTLNLSKVTIPNALVSTNLNILLSNFYFFTDNLESKERRVHETIF